ncbi:MAG: glycosyltransferase family 2 protein [Pseudomonadota bacterium]
MATTLKTPHEVTLSSLAHRQSRHGRVMAVSMMKDEGPYLLEWIAHHIAVGFTDILVYTNDCADGTDTMLRRLETLGIARHRVNAIPKGIKPQPSAIRHAQSEPEVARADWLMLIDADEFLMVRHGDGTLDPLLDAVLGEGANGIVLTWRIFGSNGITEWSRAPVTEQFLAAAPPDWNKGWGVKTLFQYDPEAWKLGIHRPKMRNKVLDTGFPDSVRWLNGSGRPMEEYFKFRGWRSIARTVGYDWAQINHYAVKSVDAYALRRVRGNVNDKADKYNSAYWALQDRNEVRDDGMLRYSARRGAVMAALLSDPELKHLHEAALARAETALAEIKAGSAYATMRQELAQAARVPITQVSAVPPKARDPAKIAAVMSAVEQRVSDRRRAERAKPAQARDLPPPDLYLRGDPSIEGGPLEGWTPNHSVELPADPRVFAPTGLKLVAAGKFQRNLARVLPGLVGEGAVVEIGAASGFLGMHLRSACPGLTVIQAEQTPSWAVAFSNIAARADQRVQLANDVQAHLPTARTLVLGDPELDPDAVMGLLDRAPDCRRLIVTGRLWAERYRERNILTAALSARGLVNPIGLDAAFALGCSAP